MAWTKRPSKNSVRRKRMVTLSVEASRRLYDRRAQLWAFGYPELAALLETTEGAVRALVARGRINPANLADVCHEWERRQARRRRRGYQPAAMAM